MQSMKTILIVFFANFIVQYILMTYLVSSKKYIFTFNLPKLYLALFIALVAVFIDFAMHDARYNVFSYHAYLSLGILIFIIGYLYTTHKFVKDVGFLREMIEHQSSSVMMSEHMLDKSDNYHIIKLAKNIIQYQTDEINNMNQLLNKLENENERK
jgi:hypothetical protein